MSELTLTIMRLGMLVLLWAFVFSVVGVLRGDLYGTHVSRRTTRGPRTAATRTKARRTKGEPTRLTVTAGPLAGTSLPLRESGLLIGRSPECALVLDDDYASGRHARIFFDGAQWLVEDLRSTNGTYLGTMRLTEPEPIRLGSVLRIGETTVELQR
jgi:pSer/pThr/pTyr-binding forkhead associated (FHA) protein